MLGKASNLGVGSNSVKWLIAVRKGTTPLPDITYKVDGVIQNDNSPIQWLKEELLDEEYPYTPPADFQTGQGVFEWSNEDNQDHTFELNSNNLDVLILAYDNPSVTQLDIIEGKKIGFVLSKKDQNLISCAGATDDIYFNSIAGYWDFYLDNEFILNGSANDLSYKLKTETNIYDGDFDGFFWLKNLDNQPHRFKFFPKHDPEVPNYYVQTSENPTYMENEDGSLTFCLAPTVEQIIGFNAVYDSVNGHIVISGKTRLANRDLMISLFTNDEISDGKLIKSDSNGNFNLRVKAFREVGIYTVRVVDSLANETKSLDVDVKSTSGLTAPKLTVTGDKTFNANANGSGYVKQDIYYSIGIKFNSIDIFDVAQFKTTLDGFSNGDFAIEANSGQKIYIASLKVYPQPSDPILIDILEYTVP